MNQVLIPMIHAFYSFSFIQLQFPSSSIKLVPQRFVLLYSNIGISKEIAFINGWIDKAGLMKSAEKYGKSPYGAHLKKVAEGKIKY